MRAVLFALVVLPLATPDLSAQVTTVVPSTLASVEGNSASSSLFQAASASIQAFYSESFLAAAGITPGASISGIAYRRNTGGTTGPAADTTIASYNILLSSSFADPASFTTTFASNVVGPQTLVRSGPINFAANSYPGGAAPNGFGPTIGFTTPYTYTGGSLLLEIRRGARAGDTVSFNTDTDNTAAVQAGTRWMFNTASDTATTGTIVLGAQVFQLQYTPVPEPSTLALAGIASSAGYWMRRRRSQVGPSSQTAATV